MSHSYQNLPGCTFKMHVPGPCSISTLLGSLEVDLGIYVLNNLLGGCYARGSLSSTASNHRQVSKMQTFWH